MNNSSFHFPSNLKPSLLVDPDHKLYKDYNPFHDFERTLPGRGITRNLKCFQAGHAKQILEADLEKPAHIASSTFLCVQSGRSLA